MSSITGYGSRHVCSLSPRPDETLLRNPDNALSALKENFSNSYLYIPNELWGNPDFVLRALAQNSEINPLQNSKIVNLIKVDLWKCSNFALQALQHAPASRIYISDSLWGCREFASRAIAQAPESDRENLRVLVSFHCKKIGQVAKENSGNTPALRRGEWA